MLSNQKAKVSHTTLRFFLTCSLTTLAFFSPKNIFMKIPGIFSIRNPRAPSNPIDCMLSEQKSQIAVVWASHTTLKLVLPWSLTTLSLFQAHLDYACRPCCHEYLDTGCQKCLEAMSPLQEKELGIETRKQEPTVRFHCDGSEIGLISRLN